MGYFVASEGVLGGGRRSPRTRGQRNLRLVRDSWATQGEVGGAAKGGTGT